MGLCFGIVRGGVRAQNLIPHPITMQMARGFGEMESMFTPADRVLILVKIHSYFAEYLCLIKWDLSGNEVWNVTWFVNQFGGKPEFQSNLWSQDNDIYICYTFIGFNSWDYSLIKCDNTANVIWNQTLESDNWYYVGNGIWGDGTNIYTVTTKGYANSWSSNNDSDLFLNVIKWDDMGNQVWNQQWGNAYISGDGIWGYGNDLYVVGTYDENLFLIKGDNNGDGFSPLNTNINPYIVIPSAGLACCGIGWYWIYQKRKMKTLNTIVSN